MIGWGVFVVVVAGVLALDLFVIRRTSRVIGLRDALVWCGVWIGLALLFNAGVWITRGHRAGMEFLTAYLIEESLSVDNLFVFLLLFAHFRVPPDYRHKVLFWGILGALVMRFAFIVAGVSLIARFEWVLYLLGAVLVYSGTRMARGRGPEVHPENSLVLRTLRRLFPITEHLEGDRFWVRRHGRRLATPLLVVLVMVETTDLVFAVDSIPAVLGISRDSFIVYTSNAFAILGLRSLFFALARMLDAFHFLHYGLALILVFVGLKMLLSPWIHLHTAVALAVVGVTLVASTIASVVWPRKEAAAGTHRDA